jgi:integrase
MARRGHGEGSIYLRSDGRWAASISLEGGKRKTFYGKTRREVQEQLKTALHQQQQGMLVTEPQQKVSSFLPQWLEDVHKHKVRPRTYERYEAAIRLHLVPGIGQYQLQKLTPQHLQKFYARKIEEGLSPTTVLGLHKVLHLALEKAVRWNLVPRNVCDAVDPPRRKRYEFQPLNQEQVRQFLAAASGHRLEALFVLALATGMRKGELMALKWQDINFSTGTLQVRRILTHMPAKLNGKGGYVEAEPKTEGSRRSITIAQLALEKLKQHRVRQLEAKLKAGPLWKENDLVFSSSVGGHLHTSRDVFTQFKKVLKQAGLPDIRFHDLRHSAATMLLGLDIHPKVVQEMLGHSQIAMTLDIYSHVLPTMQQVAVSRLNDVLQG